MSCTKKDLKSSAMEGPFLIFTAKNVVHKVVDYDNPESFLKVMFLTF